MRIRLLRPPPITVHLDRDYRVEPLWMAAAQSGYLAAYFVGGHWKLTPNHAPSSALDSACSNGVEIIDALGLARSPAPSSEPALQRPCNRPAVAYPLRSSGPPFIKPLRLLLKPRGGLQELAYLYNDGAGRAYAEL